MLYCEIKTGKFFTFSECIYSISNSSSTFYPILNTKIDKNLDLKTSILEILNIFFTNEELNINDKNYISEEMFSILSNIKIEKILDINCITLANNDKNYNDYIVIFINLILDKITNNIKNIIILNEKENFLSSIKQKLYEKFKIIYITNDIENINFHENILQFHIEKSINEDFFDEFHNNYRFFQLTNSLLLNNLNPLNLIANILILLTINKKFNQCILIESKDISLIDALFFLKKLGIEIECITDSKNNLINLINSSSVLTFNNLSFLKHEKLLYSLVNFSSEGIENLSNIKKTQNIIKINQNIKENLKNLFIKIISSNESKKDEVFLNLKDSYYQTIDNAETISIYKLNNFLLKEKNCYPLIKQYKINDIKNKNINHENIKYISEFSIEILYTLIYNNIRK